MAVRAITGPLLSAIAVGLKVPIQVTCDEQVQFAVIVIVKESRARAPSASTYSCLLCHISKGAVPVIVVEDVASKAGHINILKAVVIVVSNRNAHAIKTLWHSTKTGSLRHVSEFGISILVIQTVPKSFVRFVGRFTVWHGIVDLAAIGEKNVKTSIVVVIQKRYAPSHRLDQVFI
jgi:hypothetical protein